MTLELTIEKMVQGGDGLGRLEDGRVCFVQGALPGERCKVQLTFQKKDFTRGRAVEILDPSPDRVKPKCPLFGKCGGCTLQHLDPEKQVTYMEQVERDNFRRLAHAELPEDFRIHSGNPWGYRNRARVVFFNKKGETAVGFRAQESNDVVPFDSCPVLTENLNAFLQKMAKTFTVGSKALDVNVFDNGEGQVSYYYRGIPPQEFQENSKAVVQIENHRIESDASVFFQSNLGLLPQLVKSVRNAVDQGLKSGKASDEWLIDLFSGVGFFASILQDKFKWVTTVERDGNCLKHADINLSVKCGKNVSVENVSAPAEEWLVENVVDVPATLIVDPPRTGLPVEALNAIIKSSVSRLIYVSCDPVTLARDYAKFAQAGFTLNHAEGFAFYPQTPHLEMLFVLSR